MNIIQLSQLTETEARKYMESIIWNNGRVCPHCASKKSYELKGKSTRDGLYECADCKQQFTVKIKTIMEGSHIKFRQWALAFHLLCSSKKGFSALQLQRELGLGSYRTALFMFHRIRLAMKAQPVAGLLEGKVECDETYVGGKPRNPNKDNKRGRGTKKIPVFAMVERNGKAISYPVTNVSGKELKGAIKENVNSTSTIITDEWKSYIGIGRDFEGGHKFVNHGRKEYVCGDINTNTVESFFALLKRGVIGTYHSVSKNHLLKYCDEFSFRWNHRHITDGERTIAAIYGSQGKRLIYKKKII